MPSPSIRRFPSLAVRRFLSIIGLEAYALLMTTLRMLGDVHTDEAKYLLNIPYPHPPLARTLLHTFESLPSQEWIVRFLFATALVQAAWFVWDLGRNLERPSRVLLVGAWLTSSAVLLQAGTIMMAVLTALQGLLLLWLLFDGRDHTSRAGWIGILWMASLFTAYQAVLFLPVMLALTLRMRLSRSQGVMIVFFPVLLLCLYTLGNPLAIASMLHQAGKDLDQSMIERLSESLWIWGLGGSFLLSAFGTWGILRSRHIAWIASFLLVLCYVLLARYEYYAILFTPHVVVGAWYLLARARWRVSPWALLVMPLVTHILLLVHPPIFIESPAARTVAAIKARGRAGILLIEGPFGHDWQYESSVPVLRARPHLLQDAAAVVCTHGCSQPADGWVRLSGPPTVVWVPL